MAIIRAKEYYEQGYKQAVDIDMKAYFDTVNHDKLRFINGQTQGKDTGKYPEVTSYIDL